MWRVTGHQSSPRGSLNDIQDSEFSVLSVSPSAGFNAMLSGVRNAAQRVASTTKRRFTRTLRDDELQDDSLTHCSALDWDQDSAAQGSDSSSFSGGWIDPANECSVDDPSLPNDDVMMSTPGGPAPLVATTAGFWWEGWTPDGSSTGSLEMDINREAVSFVQLATSEHETYYKDHFYMQEHTNYCAMDPQLGPVVISMKTENVLEMEKKCFRVVVRTKTMTSCDLLPVAMFPDQPSVEQIAKVALAGLQVDRLHPCVGLTQNSLLSYDQHTLTRTFKFGVLPHRAGQTTEEQLFGNQESSQSMLEFLNCIADPIQLQGFSGYRGGLDVKTNMTGERSYYTKFLGREVMFHVSTLLPHSETDVQQVARKRHIGNDIVCVIFQENADSFQPTCIASNFLKTFVVVQPVPISSVIEDSDSTNESRPATHYRIAVCCRDDVPRFDPRLPTNRVFPRGPELRSYFLTLLLNAEHASCQAEQFAKLERRTREHLLEQLYKELSVKSSQNGNSDQTRHNIVKFVRQKISRRSTDHVDTEPPVSNANMVTFNTPPEIRRSGSVTSFGSVQVMRSRANTVGNSPSCTPGSTPPIKRQKDRGSQAAESRQKRKMLNVVDGSTSYNSDDAFDTEPGDVSTDIAFQMEKEIRLLKDEQMKLQRENLMLKKKCATLQKYNAEKDSELVASQAEAASLRAEVALLKAKLTRVSDDSPSPELPNAMRSVHFGQSPQTSVQLKQETQSTSFNAGFIDML